MSIDAITHTYQDGEEDLTGFEFNQDGFNFSFDDLKPLDWGNIEYELTNLENEAYVCVMVDYESPSVLADYLNFMFEGQDGSIQAVAGNWYPLATLGTGDTYSPSVDYCFGIYDGEDCVLDDVDYNPAQNSSLVADVSFYAIQTRNNPDFDCSSLNPEFVLSEASEQNSLNEVSQDHPWYTYEIDGLCIDFTLNNPNGYPAYFDFQIDGDPGTYNAGLSDILITQGPLSGELVGNLYSSTAVAANSSQDVTKCGTDEIRVGIHFGAEQNSYLDWATFTAE